MSEYFPLFIDISKKNILVVGAGNIAYRRVKTLLAFESQIKVIASYINEIFLEIADKVSIETRKFTQKDLDGIDMVLACTDDENLNSYIINLAKEKNILYNSCSNKNECNFYFPSIIVDDEVCIGINAKGKNHSKVKEIRQNIEKSLNIKNKIKY